MNLLDSAKTAEPWARALETLLARHGPTPIFEELAEEFGRREES